MKTILLLLIICTSAYSQTLTLVNLSSNQCTVGGFTLVPGTTYVSLSQDFVNQWNGSASSYLTLDLQHDFELDFIEDGTISLTSQSPYYTPFQCFGWGLSLGLLIITGAFAFSMLRTVTDSTEDM
jgi:hypothetical protein